MAIDVLGLAMEAIENDDDGSGFCIACGEEASFYCDPDTRNAHCNDCGKDKVFGAEEILLQLG
jgi:hypothetical protein